MDIGDVEGSSSHNYDNGHKDNENTDNKNLKKEPRDDCMERNAADENMNNQRGSHDIPEEPLGPPPANPPPQPAELETFGM
jgi:hypothetical protein